MNTQKCQVEPIPLEEDTASSQGEKELVSAIKGRGEWMPGRGLGGPGAASQHPDREDETAKPQRPETRIQYPPATVHSAKERKFHPMPHGRAAMTVTVTAESQPPSREGAARPPGRLRAPGLLEIEHGHSCYSGDTGFPWIKQPPTERQPSKIQKPFTYAPERERNKKDENTW